MIHLDSNSLLFDKTVAQDSVGFYTDYLLTDIEVTSPVVWCMVSHVYSTGTLKGRIYVTVAANANVTRSCYVTIKGKELGRDVMSVISITQLTGAFDGDARIDKIYVDGELKSEPLTIDFNEHKLNVEILATTTIPVIDSLQDDVDVTLVSEDVKSEIVNYRRFIYEYDITANPTEDPRTLQIIYTLYDINGNTGTLELNINQTAYDAGYLHVDDQYINGDEQSLHIDIENTNVDDLNYTTADTWITITDIGNDYIDIDVEANRTPHARTATVTLSGEYIYDRSQIITTTFNIFQERAMDSGVLPIWEDHLVDLILDDHDPSLGENIYYNVFIGANLIYAGHAYYIDDIPQINVTEIVRDYCIDNLILPRNNNTLKINNYIFADVYSGDTPSDVSKHVASLQYYYDYTFDHNEQRIRNCPVLDVLDLRQDVILSFLNISGESNQIRVQSGMEAFLYNTSSAGIHQYYGRPHGEILTATFHGESLSFKCYNTCSRFCLYYLNLLGGWDSLIFDGKNLESENYDPKIQLQDYLNTTNEFGKKHYLKNTTQTYKLTTRHLTDEQSRRMIHVLRSPKAFLHDLVNDKIFPVVINNKATDIKTFKNQGRKMFTYTVELEASQQKYTLN